MENERANRFLLTRHIYEASKHLSNPITLVYFDAIFAYVFDGVDPNFYGIDGLHSEDSQHLEAIWCLTKPTLDKQLNASRKKSIRKGISKSLRFKALNRDDFTCQYCGRKPPEVVLEIDHIVPVSKGGKNNLENLITACFDCNRGKGKCDLHTDGGE